MMTKVENSKQDAFIDDELLECIWVTAEKQDATTTESLFKKFDKETAGSILVRNGREKTDNHSRFNYSPD